MRHIVRIIFYTTPVIWEGNRFSEEYDWIIEYNPVAILINSLRDVLMYHQLPNIQALIIIGVISIILIVLLLNHYSKNEYKIIKAL